MSNTPRMTSRGCTRLRSDDRKHCHIFRAARAGIGLITTKGCGGPQCWCINTGTDPDR